MPLGTGVIVSGSRLRGRSSSGSGFNIDMILTRFGGSLAGSAGAGAGVGVIVLCGGGFGAGGARAGDGGRTVRRGGLKGRDWGCCIEEPVRSTMGFDADDIGATCMLNCG